jgi:formate dehydrogenase subunit gamma
MRSRTAAFCLGLVLIAAAPALAQDNPSSPSGSNPVAQSVTEQQILNEFGRAKGRVAIPDPKAAMLQQPQGRQYQMYRERLLPWIGAIAIVGMLLLLAAFYYWNGPVTMDAPPSGRTIKRFDVLERLTHWITATSFIVLAITGLNYIFGKRLLMPLIGPEAFSTWSQAAKFLHNAFAWPFVLGVIVMFVLWVRGNLPDRYDVQWLKQFGGFVSHQHPPARRFNAGQKIMFWSAVLGGGALSASGIIMLFPFWALDINGMQLAQYVHATLAMGMIAVILAHIYIGTLGMDGAFEAMRSGEVDETWAKAHHSAWVEEQHASRSDRPPMGDAVPAE